MVRLRSLPLEVLEVDYLCAAGWALTLLSEENLSYASTCQTIGLNTGYLLSYTVFLALNSEAFACVPNITLPVL